jgi:hypothetical protein
MPSRSTALIFRLWRRLFVCTTGHAFMWKRAAAGEWLECSKCLTVRIIPSVVKSLQSRVPS